MSILAITLNPAIDVVYEIENYQQGESNRVDRAFYSPGGKGNNAARSAKKNTDVPVIAMGFAGGGRGTWLEEKLQEEGIQPHFIQTGSETRQCIAVASGNETTEILEGNFSVTAIEETRFIRELKNVIAAHQVSVCTISGSFPQGVTLSFLQDVMTVLKDSGVRVMLDTSDLRLLELLTYEPEWIKPNEDEIKKFAAHLGKEADSVLETARLLLDKGAKNIIVSLGKQGMLAVNQTEAFQVIPPHVETASSVGAGDATVAGILTAAEKGLDLEGAVKRAAAFGAAAVTEYRAGVVDPLKVSECENQIERMPLKTEGSKQ
ncbi:1-phosphofructokinase family hexose kinase [Salisediminibacterium halotolerans]|uniref:Tagatose-6-phosphate kinase n=1 Tax=Salisediminibacterium halotolerans TaxID=517425 RepID=A0A1H9U7I8_9BACI|nr:1-phosphofructokinase family hexose kinase [Salisediminibacterium haloalkalitolerans]SES05425.1 tagatose 6-phosphate kinase [Salisediminibacterium haloalkalitolerans]